MDQIHVTYVDDEHVDNHEYDDNTDDGHDHNKASYGHNNDDLCKNTMNSNYFYRSTKSEQVRIR